MSAKGDWLLALDLSGPDGIVLLDGPGGLLQRSLEAGSRVSRLFGDVEEMASEAGISPREIAYVGAARGPGSFTGVRVAVMAAKTLAFALGVPLVAPSSLEAAAYVAGGMCETALAVMDARRGEIYHALYRLGKGIPIVLDEPSVSPPEAVLARLPGWLEEFSGNIGILGTGVGAYPDTWPRELVLEGVEIPNAEALARLCRLHLAGGAAVDPMALPPFYIRHPDARARHAERGESGCCL